MDPQQRSSAPSGAVAATAVAAASRHRGIALVRRPGRRLDEAIVTYAGRRPIDLELARRQHHAYTTALSAAGLRVRAVPPADDLPDAVFVEDTAVICGELAILARPGAPARRPEVAGTERALRDLGFEVARIDEPGTLDGGDVLQVGDTVYVGRSGRTNEDAICQLARLLSGLGRRVVPVDVHGCLHLKTAMTALPDGTLIGLPDLVDTTALPGLLVAPEPAGARALVLGPDHLLLAASARRTAERLRADGYRITSVDIGEFEALDAAVTCLSVIL